MKIFGHAYTDQKLKGLRDLFKNIKTGHFFKLNTGGAKAANEFCTALYTGTRGNDIFIVIEYNEQSTEETEIFDVSTYIDSLCIDTQTVASAEGLIPNDYVTFKSGATLTLTAKTPLTGGTDGTVSNANYQTFLDKIESYSFNTLGCLSADPIIKGLFAAFTKRMRDDVGVKFQTVLHKFPDADFEGIISVENNSTPELVYWVTGAEAGCDVNKSITNKAYDGEYNVDTNYSQSKLEAALKAGKFILHKVGDKARVLDDINTFVSFTDDKNVDFSSNQTMRVLDQIGNDIAALFNTKYLGKVPNDDSGRISFWNDIVKHHQEMEKLRAIEDFDPEELKVYKGDAKNAVVVEDYVTPVNCMAKLYMTVIVE